MTEFDVLIIGAGISGINAAYRLQSQLPHLRYTILEARSQLGGTWDLFKYPGIRSDSDLFTFGFAWHPWDRPEPIAEGPAIVDYLQRTTQLYGIDSHIRYNHRVRGVEWSSADRVWSLTIENTAEQEEHAKDSQMKVFSARFLIFSTGYYDYHQPLEPNIPGLDQFKGQVVRPQFWPEDLDYSDKRIVIIGSGATAITLLPKLAESARHVTMLQRSPAYILSLPNSPRRSLIELLFPAFIARRLLRLTWMLSSHLFFLFCKTSPSLSRFLLRLSMQHHLPASTPSSPHFNPRYNPWDQRLCISPNADFFAALHTDRASVETATIKAVTHNGILLNSNADADADADADAETSFLPADIIIPATGLRLQIAGGASIMVDGAPIHINQKFLWRGMMLQDVPNASFVIGYAHASWTLGADATALTMCRLLRRLGESAVDGVAVPRVSGSGGVAGMKTRPVLGLTSTYVVRAEREGVLPRVADRGPWRARGNYFWDLWFARFGDLDGGMEYE